jgi:hypothetical protein
LGGARGPAGPASAGSPDPTLRAFAGQPLVSKPQRQARRRGHGFRPLPRPGRLRSFAAIHVERQSYDHNRGFVLGSKTRYCGGVLGYTPAAAERCEWRGGTRLQIAQSDADPALAQVDADDVARLAGSRISRHGRQLDVGFADGASDGAIDGEGDGDGSIDGNGDGEGEPSTEGVSVTPDVGKYDSEAGSEGSIELTGGEDAASPVPGGTTAGTLVALAPPLDDAPGLGPCDGTTT